MCTLSDPSAAPDYVPENIKIELKNIRVIAMSQNSPVCLADLKVAVNATEDSHSARTITKAIASHPCGRVLISQAKSLINFDMALAGSVMTEAYKDPASVEWTRCAELLIDLCAKLSAMPELSPLVIQVFLRLRASKHHVEELSSSGPWSWVLF